MKPWDVLDTARIPGSGGEIRLLRRDTEYSLRIAGFELMNSRVHGTEEDLARLAIEKLPDRGTPRVLVGGLGMGFTLAAACRHMPATGDIEVAELIPAVIDWNRRFLGHVAGHPLDDPRVAVVTGDVAASIRKERARYSAILLDVDNGPEGLTRKSNGRLYSWDGLASIKRALRPGGVLAVWSATSDRVFTDRLTGAGFETSISRIRPHDKRRGARNTIWIAVRRP